MLPDILTLLMASKLPQEGLSEHIETALVAHDDADIVGSAALELYGSAALLRSVAVAPDFQGQGLGHQLTRAAIDLARQHKVSQLYLLTETASDFFPKFGFYTIDRAQVPSPVKNSLEFTTLCPDSALVMTLPILSQ
ncbi:MAG: GNAT family N-acetyltransferase [Anaerolineae bacterium]|nr:GNAT family N-acetyltransferase [Anaerolineae bacterium]